MAAWNPPPENSALFQQDLSAFAAEMQEKLVHPGFYIWEYGQQPDGSTPAHDLAKQSL